MTYYEVRGELIRKINLIELKLSTSTNKTSSEYHQLRRKAKELRKTLGELRSE